MNYSEAVAGKSSALLGKMSTHLTPKIKHLMSLVRVIFLSNIVGIYP